jgi:penicillin amidase
LTDLFAMAIEASDPAERFMPRVFSPGIFWAVSDQLSDSEKPILSGFAHDNGSAPCGWYAIGQTMPLAKSKKNAASSDYANNAEKTETAIEASGFAIPGVPFIVCGRNSDITWFLTGTFDDTFDIFIEKTGPKKNYLNEGKWTALVQKKFKIRVRGGNIEERAALYTSRGPIIAGPDKKTGYALSAAWTGFSQENPLRSLYAIGRAANNGDFTSALRGIKSFCVDAIYADKYGNIGAYRAGGIPMRTSGDGSLALPGWKNRTGWNGIYPYETLPMNYNPPDGFLITASAAARENMGTLKPEILKASDISWIRDALRSKNSRSINGLLSIHKETKSGFASFIKPGLLKIIKDSKNLTPIEKTALEIVEKWDTRMNDSSDGAALFSAFIDSFSNNIFKTRLGDCIYERIDSEFDIRMLIAALWGNEKSGWFRPKSEGKSGFSDCVQKSFSDAVKKLSGDQSKWSSGIKTDAFYRHALGHSWLRDKFLWLNIGPEPVSGLYANSSTGPAGFPVINYSCGLGEGSAYLALSSGTCGVPASAHYSDQTEVLTRGRSIRIPLKKEESLKKAKYVLNISPAK